jgi:TPR repeat protein
MIRNPITTAIAGLLVGFFVGYVVGQGKAVPMAPEAQGNPHAGVPGAPQLSGEAAPPPEGGRTAATGDPRLMEQARDLERVLAKEPNNYLHLVQMGNVQYDMQNYPKAVDYYERARAIKDDSADVQTDLGVCYREMKQPDKALVLFDKAADAAPEHWQSRYNAVIVRLFDLSDAKGAGSELAKLKQLRSAKPDLGVPDLTSLEQEIAKRGA